MKEKILPFVIGVLAGAIIATTGFLIYSKVLTNSDNNSQISPNGQMGQPPEMSNGQMGQPPEMSNGQEPPAKPDGDDGSEPPEKPEN